MQKVIKHIATAILATVLFGLLGCSRNSETEQAKVRAADEEAIRRVITESVESFNRHEPPAPDSFTQDADFVNVYGMWRRGPAEIQGRQDERMKTILRDAKITLKEVRIRFLKPDVAIVHRLQEMSGMRDDNDQIKPPHEEMGMRVLVKENGKWLTTAFHNTIVHSPGLK
jgi:uncharacterized protein (TIGR02246 family)